MTKNTTRPRI